MFFTQEDYKKIQEWIRLHSVKDTELQDAHMPLNGNEVISIVQEGESKKVYLKDFVDQVFSIGISDFINISELTGSFNITLSEAVQLVPSKARKRGQIITFKNTQNNWEVWQFRGSMNQWSILDLWNNLFDWKSILDIKIIADEEDITMSTALNGDLPMLSFKNREYDKSAFSGMGYTIVRKNIVSYDNNIYGKIVKNILVQDMINLENTIYEIRYDFDLNGETIVIPSGCTLKFNGGSFSNGTIQLVDTSIMPNGTIIESCIKGNVEGTYAKGQCLFDSSLNIPKWWNGNAWVNALGTEV